MAKSSGKLSEAEREQHRVRDRERLKRAAEQLLSSEGWERWVRVRSRNGLARYSVNSQHLIALSRPDATFVAGFRSWLELGCQVRKGEKAIWILASLKIKERDRVSEETGETRTLFRAVPVFDRGQATAGENPAPLEPPSRKRSTGTGPAAAKIQRRWSPSDALRPRCRSRMTLVMFTHYPPVDEAGAERLRAATVAWAALLGELHAVGFRPYLELETGDSDDQLRVFCELDNETLLDLSIADEGIPDAPVSAPESDWVVFVQSASGGYLAEVFIESSISFRGLARRLRDLVASVAEGEHPFFEVR